MRTAVVTGANGFVGSALVRELSRNGVAVTAVVRDESGNVTSLADLPGVQIVCCSMERLGRLPELVRAQPEIFYHLAWSGASGGARGDCRRQLKNVEWTVDAVDAAGAMGCRRFVGVGSSAEVDAWGALDDAAPGPAGNYGAAKIAAHYMSKMECGRLGIEHVWGRLANTYGPGDKSANFINSTIAMLRSGKPADFTACEQRYDFVHVRDAAQGLYWIGASGKSDQTYYIGSTRPGKLKDFVYMIRDVVNPAAVLNFGALPFQGASQEEGAFDCSRLIADTGYSPQVLFTEGIRETAGVKEEFLEGRIKKIKVAREPHDYASY